MVLAACSVLTVGGLGQLVLAAVADSPRPLGGSEPIAVGLDKRIRQLDAALGGERLGPVAVVAGAGPLLLAVALFAAAAFKRPVAAVEGRRANLAGRLAPANTLLATAAQAFLELGQQRIQFLDRALR